MKAIKKVKVGNLKVKQSKNIKGGKTDKDKFEPYLA